MNKYVVAIISLILSTSFYFTQCDEILYIKEFPRRIEEGEGFNADSLRFVFDGIEEEKYFVILIENEVYDTISPLEVYYSKSIPRKSSKVIKIKSESGRCLEFMPKSNFYWVDIYCYDDSWLIMYSNRDRIEQ